MLLSQIQSTLSNLSTMQYVIIFADIVIVAFLIYKFSMLLARTKVLALVGVVLLLLVVNFASNLMNLDTLHWVLSNILTYLAFGVVVILQPELRHFIAESSNLFNWSFVKHEIPVEILTNAIQKMASKKIGSIIICLGKIKPYHVLNTGVQLQANVSEELIETIFCKNTPLHDGALILEKNTILAASCYLPLSNSRGIVKKRQGARFRAALGMSEEIDGLILVTSEETGKIYIFRDGENQEVPNQKKKIIHILEDYLLSQKNNFYGKKLKQEFEEETNQDK